MSMILVRRADDRTYEADEAFIRARPTFFALRYTGTGRIKEAREISKPRMSLSPLSHDGESFKQILQNGCPPVYALKGVTGSESARA